MQTLPRDRSTRVFSGLQAAHARVQGRDYPERLSVCLPEMACVRFLQSERARLAETGHVKSTYSALVNA